MTFAQYKSLLINTATRYDKQHDKPSSNGKTRRSAFKSETMFDDDNDGDGTPDFDYDVDTSPYKLQAYAMNRHRRHHYKTRLRMPIARWKALSEQAQGI